VASSGIIRMMLEHYIAGVRAWWRRSPMFPAVAHSLEEAGSLEGAYFLEGAGFLEGAYSLEGAGFLEESGWGEVAR
jgi:hypothetical protein